MKGALKSLMYASKSSLLTSAVTVLLFLFLYEVIYVTYLIPDRTRESFYETLIFIGILSAIIGFFGIIYTSDALSKAYDGKKKQLKKHDVLFRPFIAWIPAGIMLTLALIFGKSVCEEINIAFSENRSSLLFEILSVFVISQMIILFLSPLFTHKQIGTHVQDCEKCKCLGCCEKIGEKDRHTEYSKEHKTKDHYSSGSKVGEVYSNGSKVGDVYSGAGYTYTQNLERDVKTTTWTEIYRCVWCGEIKDHKKKDVLKERWH